MPLLTWLNSILLPADLQVGDPGHADYTNYANQSLHEIKTWGNALEASTVTLTGAQTISGIKTFSNGIHVITPTTATMATTKAYVDTGLDGKANASHDHNIANITGLQTTLDNKQDAISTGLANQFYASNKTWQEITISNISGLQTALDAKQSVITAGTTAQYYRGDKTWATLNWSAIDGKPTTFTPSTHTHARADITGLSGGTAGQVLARSGADGLSWITLTGGETPQAVDSVNGKMGAVVLNLSDLGTSVQTIAESYYAYETWHDTLAFGRHIALPTFQTYDGSWSTGTLPTFIFDNKESTKNTVISGGVSACRFTWSNPSNLAYSAIRVFAISYGYSAATRAVNTLIESSSDGSSWTTIFNNTTTSNQGGITEFAEIPGNWGGATYLRITITKTSGTGEVNIVELKGLTRRKGDQGGGAEYSYPFDWDASRKITVEDLKINKASTIGQVWVATSTSGDGAWSNVPTHSHITDDINGLSDALNAKANSSHTHIISNITNLQTVLNGKSDVGHGHTIADVADLQSSLDGKANTSRNVNTGTGLSGGGNLSADRTISLNAASIASLARADIAVRGAINGVDNANIRVEIMTAAEYAAATKNSNTLYFVT